MKENNKDHPLVLLTDIQLHSNKSNNRQSFKRKIEKGIKGKKSERYYGGKFKLSKDGTLELYIPLPKEVRGQRITFALPCSGLPVSLGKDSIEKIESLKKNNKD